MQRAIARDSKNRLNYAMCAINPSRIWKTFTNTAPHGVVDGIAVRTGTLLEIVNYNVEVSTLCLHCICFDSHFHVGPTICRAANHDQRAELPESLENRRRHGMF